MKKSLLALIVIAVAAQVTMALPDIDNISKDVEIMENILDTALKQNNEKGIRYASISSVYLDRQGILFDITVHNNITGGHGVSSLVPPIPPIPVIPDDVFAKSGNGQNTHIKIDIDMLNDEIERAMHSVDHVFSDEWEKMHELTADKRELEWEIRDLDRRRRDIDFSLRHAEKKQKRELESEIKDIKRERDMLNKKLTMKNNELTRVKAEKEKSDNARRENDEKNIKAFLQHFESTVSDVLCRYGGGLKSLPDSENVTFHIKNIKRKKISTRVSLRDKIYVFPKKSMTRCVKNKIQANEIFSEGSSYIF